MEMTDVISSNLHSVGYEDGRLHVAFKNSRTGEKSATWEYGTHNDPVPESVYNGLLRAESPGRYFNSHVKGVFQGRKLEE